MFIKSFVDVLQHLFVFYNSMSGYGSNKVGGNLCVRNCVNVELLEE